MGSPSETPAHTRPVLAGSERARQIEPLRFDLVWRQAKRSTQAVAWRQAREIRQQAEDRRHQLIAGDARRPLRDVFEVSRVEGQD